MISGRHCIYFVLLAILLFSLWKRKSPKENRRIATHAFPTIKKRRDDLYGRLLCQVLGDRQKAERLIKHAQDENPGLAEDQCIEMASRSLEREITRWD